MCGTTLTRVSVYSRYGGTWLKTSHSEKGGGDGTGCGGGEAGNGRGQVAGHGTGRFAFRVRYVGAPQNLRIANLYTLPSTLAGRSGSPVCTRARVLQPSYADIHSEERCEKTSVDPVRRQPGRPRTTRDEARRV